MTPRAIAAAVTPLRDGGSALDEDAFLPYAEFLAAIKNRRHPRHTELREWIGRDFNPEAFDLQAVNAALRRLSGS